MNQEIVLINKEVARVTHTDVKSHQFMQKIKFKPVVHITDLPKKITSRELLASLKNYEAISVFVPTRQNSFCSPVTIVSI